MDSLSFTTFKGWMLNRFNDNELVDLCQYGTQDVISDSETTALYVQYYKDIWNILYEMCEQLGFVSYYELIMAFNGAVKATHDDDQFKRLLV